MYVKIKDGAVQKFPYLLRNLKEDNPSTSFPAEIPEATLNEYGVYIVTKTSRPSYDHKTHKVEEVNPVLSDGVWKQTWSVVQLSTELANKYVRSERTALLRDTDHYALSDTPSMTTEMTTYRQALRDVPSQSGFPFTVTWPTKP